MEVEDSVGVYMFSCDGGRRDALDVLFRFAAIAIPLLFAAIGLVAPLVALTADLGASPSHADLRLGSVLTAVLARTIGFAAAAACAATAAAWAFAIAIDGLESRVRRILLTLTIVPAIVHFVLRTYGLHVLFGPRGLLNSMLLATGAVDAPVAFTYSATGTCIALTSWLLPASCLFMYIAVRHVPFDLTDAAYMLGASPWAAFRTVTFSHTLPAAILLLAFNFALGYGTYLSPELLGGLDDITVVRVIAQWLREGRPEEAAWFGTWATMIPLGFFVVLARLKTLATRAVT